LLHHNSENLKGRYNFEDLGTDSRMISEWFLEKQDGKMWTAFISFRIGARGGLL
jgi:hypothetical protein